MKRETGFYVIQLVPDLSLGRLKLGITDNPGNRLRVYFTAAPTAKLIAWWPVCDRTQERLAYLGVLSLSGSAPVGGEVVDVRCAEETVAFLGEFFGHPPSAVDVPKNPARKSFTVREGLGGRLCRLREEKGWTRVQFANEVDVSTDSIWMWESNYSRPRPERLTLIAKLFGVEPADLLRTESEE